MHKYETAIGAAGGVVVLLWLIALAMGQVTTGPSGGDGGAGGMMFGGPGFVPGFGGGGFMGPGFAGPDAPMRPGMPAPLPGQSPQPVYPIPYRVPTAASIDEALHRVLGFAETSMPAQALDKGRAPIVDLRLAASGATIDRGANNAFSPLDYTMGVTHTGMLACAEVTGDKRFSDFVAKHMTFLHDAVPYFQKEMAAAAPAAAAPATAPGTGAQGAAPGPRGPLGAILAPNSLDDCGSMCAAMIKAREAKIGPDQIETINRWIDFVHNKQFRLADGTLARHRPQEQSVWADDLYMSVPALAGAGTLTGDKEYFDDAIKQVKQFAHYLFIPAKGIYMHGVNMDQPDNPEFYWGRANGWAMMADCALLDALPETYPGRDDVLNILKAQIKAIAALQSGDGLWHQLLDRTDSYQETSCSAMFVYCIAHAIDKGWISPVSYGNVAYVGWNAVSMRISPQGQVVGTCVATTFAADAVYYYARPYSGMENVDASHGYGPVLLAGAETMRMLKLHPPGVNSDGQTYKFVPTPATAAGPTPG